LKEELSEAKKIGDSEAVEKIKVMLGEEKTLISKQKRAKGDQETLSKLK
jgi:hypothetical protein